MYWGSGRYAEALPNLQRAVLLNPTYAWARSGLALTQLCQGRPEEDRAAFGHAIRAWSRNAPYTEELADRAFDFLEWHHRRDDEVLREAARHPSAWLGQNRWDGIHHIVLPLLATGGLSLLRDSVALLRYTRSVIRAHPDTGPRYGGSIVGLVDAVVRELPETQSGEHAGWTTAISVPEFVPTVVQKPQRAGKQPPRVPAQAEGAEVPVVTG
ncbi:tetratricopeptide repeat protein [Streptomyces hokutonensis]|uniref:tetratricopeptide repeat protein n=1 Tax=Streptomyces hokutonensis TaxID=1306990 RepID=UPI003F6E6936